MAFDHKILYFTSAAVVLEAGAYRSRTSPNKRQHLLGVGYEDSEWGRRTTKGVLPEEIEVWAFLQPML